MAKDIVLIENLVKSIDDEFAWRRKELSILKGKIPKDNNPLQSAMLRAAIPLLYAHWEGFVKKSMSYYLEHIARKHLKHKDLKVKFITLSLQNKIGSLAESDFVKRTKAIELLFTQFQNKSNIPHKNIIHTKSNLRYEVLEEILYLLDLGDQHVENHKTLINDLVDLRNHIAHGDQNLLDSNTFSAFHNDIVALMDFLRSKIQNNAVLESYKNKTPLFNGLTSEN